jgi:type IV pilus assembly protein PilC
MPTYLYKYETKFGTKTGEYDAETIAGAETFLRRQKINYTYLKEKPKDLLEGFGGHPTTKDLVVFVRQFSTMINAGVPLVQCLEILGTQADNRMLSRAILDLKARLEQGDSFADALRRHPKIFDNLFCYMVEAGELGGILDVILNRLAAYLEKAAALTSKVKAALVYPAMIVIIASGVVTFLLVFIIPQFAVMFASMGNKELPAVTRSVVFLSDTIINNWYIFAALPVAAFFGIKNIYKTDRGRYAFDKALLKIPVIGGLIQKVSVAKFTRTMGTLIASGVPIMEGLNVTAKTAGNKVIENAVLDIIDEIKQGKGLAEPLRDQGVFPAMVVQMISVGEHTGALDEMLSKIADFYDQEVDDAVEALTSMLEPLLMVFLGVVVGYVVIAMYMPIFQMGSGV